MVRSAHVFVGCRVEGSHGPLTSNPNTHSKRRVREKVVGTVIKAAGLHNWDVNFDFDGKVKTVSSRSLKIVPVESGIPVNEITATALPDATLLHGGIVVSTIFLLIVV